MAGITVKVDTSDLVKLQEELQSREKAINRAMRRVLKDTIKTVRVRGVRHARQRYTFFEVNRLKIREKLDVKSGGNFSGELIFSGRRGVGLRNFRPSPGRVPDWKGVDPKKRKPLAGISSTILRGGKRRVYTGPDGEKPFWARAKQGFMALFYRTESFIWQYGGNNQGKRVGGKLKMLYGPSPIQALGNSAKEMLEEVTGDTLAKNMQRALRAAIKGYQK